MKLNNIANINFVTFCDNNLYSKNEPSSKQARIKSKAEDPADLYPDTDHVVNTHIQPLFNVKSFKCFPVYLRHAIYIYIYIYIKQTLLMLLQFVG